ncbi:MAG TPA: hypothetical protein VG498_20885 [Terriglobales bacterium]|nr:hypothetical protein [Terriglobales bacterium]
MDFSSAGYKGGGVALPGVPAQVTLTPSGGDDTAAIQSSIDTISGMPMDANGFRGAVQLSAGAFSVSSTLNITASGVVLRGAGSGADGTVINMTGDPFLFLRIAGTGSAQTVGSSTLIADLYVPAGATSFTVNDASGFSVGDHIMIRRTVTNDWIHLLGMDTLVRSGAPQTWISAGSTITADRVITAISGNRITLDVPYPDNLDSQFVSPPGVSVAKYIFPGRISQVGAEGFSVMAVPRNVDITDPQYQGLSVSAVMDAWVRDVIFQDTQNTTTISGNVKQMTFDKVTVKHVAPHTGDGPADFAVSGTQVLLNNCSVLGVNNGVWPAVTQSRVTGPVVLLNFYAEDRGFAPHQRWATGLLCDGCRFPYSKTSDKAGVAYSNRGNLGSGQGWDAGWSVAWNVTAQTFTIQQPPGSQNFCIGCTGQILTQRRPGDPSSAPSLPNGIYDSYGTPVSPSSLYLEQLYERKGPQAVIDIGYLDYLKSIDSIAPVTTAFVSPNPNGNGWNNSNVTITLSATDNAAGTGVQRITYSASGAQNIAATNVTGTSASIPITAEGVTTLTFFATDFAGNAEVHKTLDIKLDKTPPTVTCSATPKVLWPPDHRLVPVSLSVNVADSGSGANSFKLASNVSNEPDSGAGDIQGFATGTAATSGFLREERLGTGTGRVYTFVFNGTDRAGNSATCTTNVVVPHDQGE